MPLYPIDEYIARLGTRRENMARHGGRYRGWAGNGVSVSREWGVYLVDGEYYISTWTDLPFSNVGAIDKFYAYDKRDALIKGESIVEEHAKKNVGEKAVKTVYRDYSSESREGGYYGV